ncbi:DUF2147 domain-containing protein [Aquiflexum lacus]|uniref:DUF2147 domain-containing protein n=1 Tax=Aquiflexum lacus TaxID=2483805 RepID=UPI0018934FCE|nr:DUF2147 domain-containing protein [Aquiflexum lacus]
MKYIISALTVFLFVTAEIKAQTIEGTWQYKDDLRVTYFLDKEGKLCNKIVWLKEAKDENGNPKLDAKNPDKSLRNRPVIGMTSISGLKYKGNNIWEGGFAYDFESGRTYKCKLELVDANTIKLSAYFLGIPFSAEQKKVSIN